MRAYIGIGSNLGDRRGHLLRALDLLGREGVIRRVSPIFESAALLPPNPPLDGAQSWDLPFLNIAVELTFGGTAFDLLARLQNIEALMGREKRERWAPRVIDLDLLLAGSARIDTTELQIPHPRMAEREFVLAPLAAIDPTLRLPDGRTVLQAKRGNARQLPQWMAIVNLTPDSFSQDGLPDASEPEARQDAYVALCDALDAAHVHMIDAGGESTRPGATPVTPSEEWRRLQPFIDFYRQRYCGRPLRPLLSVDTRHAETAALAAAHGVDIINDVSGAANEALLNVVRDSGCRYVLMHSMSVPANPAITLASTDPVASLLSWITTAVQRLEAAGIDRSKVIVDPGIGFGKRAGQSLALLRGIESLYAAGCPLLVGHSRKSFMKTFSPAHAAERDPESIGISLNLAQRGVDVLRVHQAPLHARAHLGFMHASSA